MMSRLLSVLTLFDQQFLAKHRIVQVQYSLYAPDLVLCFIFLFPELKIPLKDKRFEYKEDIKRNIKMQFYIILKEEFKRCFEQ